MRSGCVCECLVLCVRAVEVRNNIIVCEEKLGGGKRQHGDGAARAPG
jgi:hypothetical protein